MNAILDRKIDPFKKHGVGYIDMDDRHHQFPGFSGHYDPFGFFFEIN
jgi:hypothetical protein